MAQFPNGGTFRRPVAEKYTPAKYHPYRQRLRLGAFLGDRQLIGYPGPRMSFLDEIDKNFGQAWHSKPMSLEQITGRPVKGWEEERD